MEECKFKLECGFWSYSVCMTGTIVAQANFTVVVTTRVFPLTGQTVCLLTEKIFNIKTLSRHIMRGGHTSAFLMNCSVAVFSFSLCPLQALSADTCRARPKENVRIQGLGRGQLLMALRWIDASSSLWPPERNAIPAGNRKYPFFFPEHLIPIFTPLTDHYLAYLEQLGGQCDARWSRLP